MDVPLPELGEGVYEAELVTWHVKPGDRVERGQSLAEVMTDKASMELPAPLACTVTALRAEPGNTIKVGEVILSCTPQGGNGEEKRTEKRVDQRIEQQTEQRSESVATKAPVHAVGEQQRESATAQPPTAMAQKFHTHSAAEPVRVAPPVQAVPSIRAAPSVRLLARKLGIDLTQVRGSGPGGRVLLDDVTSRLAPIPQDAASQEAARPVEPVPDYGSPGDRIKVQGLRRKIAEHMLLAKRSIPHYSLVDECDATELVKLRESLKERFARSGAKLTYLAFFVKAAAAALREMPIVNSSFDEAAGEIVLHEGCHVGIAVATPAGLLVPVVRHADGRDLLEIAREIDRLRSEARAGKSRLDDLRGGTFTVTSIGNIGGLISTPVINHPEVAILGVGKVVKRPVYDGAGNLRPADLVYLSFSFDHRVLDGAIGAAFSNAVRRRLQNPAALLLR